MKTPIKLYVNTAYDNEVTLDTTLMQDVEMFGEITWRDFLEKVRGESLPSNQVELRAWLIDHYAISENDLDELLSQEAIDRFYTDLSYYQDNVSGGNARAFKLLVSLQLMSVDKDGNGNAEGIELVQTTSNGPRKYVFIENEKAAEWLISQAADKGVDLEIEFK